MLDLTGKPGPRKPSASRRAAPPAGAGPTLADLRAHVAARTDISPGVRTRYLGAIDKTSEVLNTPLKGIMAELALVEVRFPLAGFDPAHWPTNQAYETFRRRLQATLKTFLGVHAEQARLRAMEDDWTCLFAAVQPLTEAKLGQGDWHPMKLSALKTFSLVARSYGWQPRDLGRAEAARLDKDFTGNKREANRRALDRLDELRQFPEARPWLPPRPIAFTPEARVPDLAPLEAAWESQIAAWTLAVTQTNWDPVGRKFADDHQGHAHVMRSALRTTLRLAREEGLLIPGTADLVPLIADDEALCVIAGAMFDRSTRAASKGHLAPRTSRKYLGIVNQLRAHLGLDTALLKQVLANNDTARKGKAAEKSMTPKNRAFCETLVGTPAIRRRFLGSFRPLRAEAETMLHEASLAKRDLTGRERAQVRLLGASAAFTAIAIGGAPIRVGNAMGLTCIGEDAQIRIPTSAKKQIRVLIPAELTKNKEVIEFPIKPNGYGYHDTLLWYVNEIRPLFPHAKTSPYLFPAITVPGAPLGKDYFGAHFAALMRTVVNLPMTPHQMRHGQTSLLLDRHPNEIEVIAKRIDDTPGTLRTFYGWLNALKLVERGQDLLVGLMND